LNGRLYNNEVEYLVVFQTGITPASYEKLVNDILDLRKLSTAEMAIRFKADEHTYVKSVYEWEYYTQTLLEQVGIINRFEGELICKLYHPTKTNSKSLPTGRKATLGYITINSAVKPFIEKMMKEYSCFDKPISLSDPERLTIDCIKEVYSFYPELLLNEIGESDELSKLLELPKLIEEYSNNPENDTQ
jgi:type II restriction enzyme